jgi:hypothetical protein
MSTYVDQARLAADVVYESGSRPDDIRAAAAKLGSANKTFFERLAIRAALDAAERTATGDEPPASLVEAMIGTYETERAASAMPDLSKPAIWLAAKEAFGNDVSFMMKLVARQVTSPTARFLRYCSDVLGVGLGSVKQHFQTAPDHRLVGVERKASGKQIDVGPEPFDEAVRAASVPDDLKRRWLSE